MKIGLFFGSFDPIHIGHLSIIAAVKNRKLVDQIHVIPAWHNPFKEHNPAPFEDRFRMIVNDIKYSSGVYVNDIEYKIYKETGLDKIPTWKVLEKLKDFDYPLIKHDFYIITTEETYAEIPKWEKGQEILDNYNFIICQHPMSTKLYSSNCQVVYIYNVETSSTLIRNGIYNDQIVYPFITQETEWYIQKHGLYKNEKLSGNN